MFVQCCIGIQLYEVVFHIMECYICSIVVTRNLHSIAILITLSFCKLLQNQKALLLWCHYVIMCCLLYNNTVLLRYRNY